MKKIILRDRYCCPHYTAEEAETPGSNDIHTQPAAKIQIQVWDSCPFTADLPASFPSLSFSPPFLPSAMGNAAF